MFRLQLTLDNLKLSSRNSVLNRPIGFGSVSLLDPKSKPPTLVQVTRQSDVACDTPLKGKLALLTHNFMAVIPSIYHAWLCVQVATPHIHQHQHQHQTGIITGMCYLKLIALAAQCQCQLLLVLHSRLEGANTHTHTYTGGKLSLGISWNRSKAKLPKENPQANICTTPTNVFERKKEN